jgi:hypothetical protein
MNDRLEHDDYSVLATMREQIAATPMLPAPRRLASSFLRRPRVLAAASAGVAALFVTLALTFVGVSSPPAFAVTTDADGTTTITLNALSAVGALNGKLAAAGVHVRVAPVVLGCTDPVQIAGSDAPPATLQASRRPGATACNSRQQCSRGREPTIRPTSRQARRLCWRRPSPGSKSSARSTKTLPPPASDSPQANSPFSADRTANAPERSAETLRRFASPQIAKTGHPVLAALSNPSLEAEVTTSWKPLLPCRRKGSVALASAPTADGRERRRPAGSARPGPGCFCHGAVRWA